MVLKINSGYSPEYLLKEVATGRENYYTGAVAEGEPPGRWWGAGAETLGLTGEVAAQDMRAVYERFLDPRAEGFSDPDRWDSVQTLGHTGRKYATEQQLFDEALAREPDADPERRAELWTEAGRSARHNVAFFDATFSVQKSITLVHTAFEAREVAARAAGNEEEAAAWGTLRQAVEDAIHAGNDAGLAYLQEHGGYTRRGHHGGAAGRYEDAHRFTVASFFQHDSREGDPQLHIHNGIHNRVEAPDGTWLTIDGQSLHRACPAAAAVAERTTNERFTATVGMLLATRPDGKAREVVGVSPEAMGIISTRRHQVTAKTAELVEAFRARYGKDPNGYQLDRLAQTATLATRKAKSHVGRTREQLLDDVEQRMRGEVDTSLGGIADAALAARPEELVADRWVPREVIALALHDVQQRKAAWTRSELIAALDRALPDHLGVADGAQVAKLLESLADEALASAVSLAAPEPGGDVLPDELRRADGSSVLIAPGSELYATPEHVHTERALVGAACGPRDRAVLAGSSVTRFLAGLEREGVRLDPAQEAAVRGILTSGAPIDVLIGPPGTGKSYVVGTVARAWCDPGLTGGPQRRMFGVATAERATDILRGQGLTARNIAAFLGIQRRLAEGRPLDDGELAFRLRPTDIVVIDESAMTDTPAITAVRGYVDAAGARVLLAGDPGQLASVGAGGAMELVAESGAPRYELTEARRFLHAWERDASLRLRAGNLNVLDEYHRQGRLRDCGTVAEAETSAASAWLADTLAGHTSLLEVDSNQQADRLSAQMRARMVELGLASEEGVRLGLTAGYAGVGDLVEARSIAHDLAGYAGNQRGPYTRELFRVLAIRPDGGLEVTTDLTQHPPHRATRPAGRDNTAADDSDGTERMVLSPRYVAEELALGYASTEHCVQGGSVYSSYPVVTSNTDRRAFTVGMSRGMEINQAHCATVVDVPDPADGGKNHQIHRSAKALCESILDTESPDRSALAEQRESADRAASLQTIGERLADRAHEAATARTMTWLDRLTDHDVLSPEQRDRLAAEDGAANLTRILRRAETAGHDPYQLLFDAITSGPLAGSRNLCNVIYGRLRDAGHDLTPASDRAADLVPALDNPGMSAYLGELARLWDKRATGFGAQAADDPPRWAAELLGPVPVRSAEPEMCAQWERQAGAVVAHREQNGEQDPLGADLGAPGVPIDPAEVLGAAPRPGRVEAYAAFHAAWDALGRPQADREDLELSDGAHFARIRAWEREERALPPHVAHELAGTRQTAHEQRQTAVLRRAEADAAETAQQPDPARAGELRAQAQAADAEAAQLDHHISELEEAEHARNLGLMHGAQTKLRAERSRLAIAQRDADRPEQSAVTATEWTATRDPDYQAAMRDDDPHRAISEDDLTDEHDDRHDDHDRAADEAVELGGTPVLETSVEDVRDTAARETRHPQQTRDRVPPADETAEDTSRARRTLAELRARADYEASLDTAEDRDADLTREDPYTDTSTDQSDDVHE